MAVISFFYCEIFCCPEILGMRKLESMPKSLWAGMRLMGFLFEPKAKWKKANVGMSGYSLMYPLTNYQEVARDTSRIDGWEIGGVLKRS